MIRLIRAGIIGLAGVFCCTVFAADSTSVKNDTNAGISEDILVDDDDEDLLKLSKDTTAAKQQQVTPEQVIAKDTAKALQPVVQKDSVTSKKAELDDVLILEGEADDLLGTTTPKPKDTSVATVKTDTTKAGTGIVENKAAEPTPSTVIVEKPKTATAAPVKIEKADSINFAKSLKNYRNPKIAMLLSLILPGAGEVYAKNYVRAGIFGAMEAGIIVSGLLVRSKSNQMRDDARKFADQHYSADSLIAYYTKFKSKFFNNTNNINDLNEADSVFYNAINDLNPTKFSKNTRDFYEIVNDPTSPYIQGWDDVTPKVNNNYDVLDSAYVKYDWYDSSSSFDSSCYFIKKSDPDSIPSFGESQNQQTYNRKVAKAEDKYERARTILFLMVVNRLASAVDAGICAKAYNDKLLGKKSVWQNINIKDITVATGNGYAAGYALEVRF